MKYELWIDSTLVGAYDNYEDACDYVEAFCDNEDIEIKAKKW